ncbi:MAG: tape measure protein, partial [Xanthomonadaceae bacterium]|nr:tape measure protein [Xanthomonadaceae bacterium]
MTDPTVTARVRADAKQLISELRGASTASKQFGKDAEQAGAQAERGANRAAGAFSRVREGLTGLAGAARLVIGSLAVQKLVQFADAATLLDARLRIVSRSSEEYANASGLVLDIAQRTRSELNSTANLYTRLSTALKDTGASQQEVARLTETINKAFVVSGASAGEAAAAITQLSQGLASGTLRGDEFNSVAEQAPVIMDALAKQLGVTRGELREMAADGKITADLVRTALAGAADEIDAKFAQVPQTIGGAFTQLTNALQSTVGWFNEAGGASNLVVQGINFITEAIQNLPATLFGVIGRAREFWETLKLGFELTGANIKFQFLRVLDAIKIGIAEQIARIALSLGEIDVPGVRDLAQSLASTALGLKDSADGAAQYRQEIVGIVQAGRERIEAIRAETAAAQNLFAQEQAARASTREGIRLVRESNVDRKEAERLSRQWAAAERELANQRRPLLEQFIAEIRARRELRDLLADADQDIEREIQLAGLSGQARRELENAITAENFAREVNQRNIAAGRVLTEDEIDAIRRNYQERLNLRDATAEQTEQSTRAAEEFRSAWLSAADSVTAAIADFATGGIKSFSDFASSLKNIARRLIADLIQQFLRNRIVVPITAQITGQGGGGLGGLANAAGGGGGGILGGLGGIAGALGFSGFAAGTGVLGATIGATGSILGGLAATTQFGVASLAAGNIGVGLGALAGPIGIAVAALSLLAGALKDTTRRITVIGSELVGTAGFRNLAPDAIRQSALGGFAFASIDNVSREERDQLAQAIQQFDAGIAALLTDEQRGRVRSAIATQATQATEGAITAETFIQRRFDAILSAMDQSVQDFVRAGSGFEEQMQRLGQALQFPREIQAVIDGFAREDLLANMTDLERRTFEVNERFDAAIEYLTERSATEDQLAQVEAFRARALAALTEATEESIDSIVRNGQGLARMLGQLRFDESLVGLSDLDRALALLARELEEAIIAAQGMGATEAELAEIREIYAARRTRIERQASEQALDAAADYWAQIAAFNQQGAQQAADAIRNAF